jgi:hypothetical protein
MLLTPTLDAYALWHRLQDNGGFTVDPETGEIPTKGYVVSLPGFERVYPAADVHPSDIVDGKRDALTARAYFERPGRVVYYGAWLDTETRLTYLDASVVVQTRSEAERLARQWNQISYFDLQTNSSVYTHKEIAA